MSIVPVNSGSGLSVATLVAIFALPVVIEVVVKAVMLQPLTVDVLVVHVCVTCSWLVPEVTVVGKHLTKIS